MTVTEVESQLQFQECFGAVFAAVRPIDRPHLFGILHSLEIHLRFRKWPSTLSL